MPNTSAPDEKRLREHLRYLSMHRSELASAQKIDAQADQIERIERAIRETYLSIQKHCERTGLPLPADVPAKK